MRVDGALIFLMAALIVLGILIYHSADSIQTISNQQQIIEEYQKEILDLEYEIQELTTQKAETTRYNQTLEENIQVVTSENQVLSSQLQVCNLYLQSESENLTGYTFLSALIELAKPSEQTHSVYASGFSLFENAETLVQSIVIVLFLGVLVGGIYLARKILRDSRGIVQLHVTRKEADQLIAMRRNRDPER